MPVDSLGSSNRVRLAPTPPPQETNPQANPTPPPAEAPVSPAKSPVAPEVQASARVRAAAPEQSIRQGLERQTPESLNASARQDAAAIPKAKPVDEAAVARKGTAPAETLKHTEFTADTDGAGKAGGSGSQQKRTSFEITTKEGHQYLNGDTTPYLAMRSEDRARLGVQMGDLVKVSHDGAKVWDPRNPAAEKKGTDEGWLKVPPKEAWAIVGDSRGAGRSASGGEGSPSLHKALGGNGRGNDGTMKGSFKVEVYPNSGEALVGRTDRGNPTRIPTPAEIAEAGRRLTNP
jgi:hypothetical protein